MWWRPPPAAHLRHEAMSPVPLWISCNSGAQGSDSPWTPTQTPVLMVRGWSRALGVGDPRDLLLFLRTGAQTKPLCQDRAHQPFPPTPPIGRAGVGGHGDGGGGTPKPHVCLCPRMSDPGTTRSPAAVTGAPGPRAGVQPPPSSGCPCVLLGSRAPSLVPPHAEIHRTCTCGSVS